jgi:hypothetical protein
MKNMARKPLFAPEFREKWDQLPQWLRILLDADVIRVLNDHCPHTTLCAANGIKEAVGTVFVIYFATDEIAGEQIFLDCNFRPDDNPEPPYRDVMALPFIPGIDLENFIDQYELVEFSVPQNNNFDTKHVREEAVWSMHVSPVVDFSFTILEKPRLPLLWRMTYPAALECWEDPYMKKILMGFIEIIGCCPRSGELPSTGTFDTLVNQLSHQLTLNAFVELAILFDMSNDIFEMNWTRARQPRAIDFGGAIAGKAAGQDSKVVASDVRLVDAVPCGSRLAPMASAFIGWCAWQAGVAHAPGFAAMESGGAPTVGTPVPRSGDFAGNRTTGLAFDWADFDHLHSIDDLIPADHQIIATPRRHSRLAFKSSLPFALRTYNNLKRLPQSAPAPDFATTLSGSGRRCGADVRRSIEDIILAQGFAASIVHDDAATFINRRSLCGRTVDAEFDRPHPTRVPGNGDGGGIDLVYCIPKSADTALAPTGTAAALSKSGANPKAVCDITAGRSPQNAVWAVPSGHI